MAKNRFRAFTLIELLVVIVVIAILATIAYPVYTGVQERAKVTKDMNNLRQIGIATQTYMNDNDGVFPGSTTRAPSETGTQAPVSPISFGINSNVYPNNVAISADKITKPAAFILFAPAQAAGASVTFSGLATTGAPGVQVLGTGGGTATSTPGGAATAGTQNNRTRINALFADLHCETMSWSGAGATFTNNAVTASDPDGELRWKPYIPYP